MGITFYYIYVQNTKQNCWSDAQFAVYGIAFLVLLILRVIKKLKHFMTAYLKIHIFYLSVFLFLFLSFSRSFSLSISLSDKRTDRQMDSQTDEYGHIGV
jgi:predicted membrane channel-forming protein YqfA (hemolysin III family)